MSIICPDDSREGSRFKRLCKNNKIQIIPISILSLVVVLTIIIAVPLSKCNFPLNKQCKVRAHQNWSDIVFFDFFFD